MSALVERMKQLQEANRVVDKALQDTWRYVPYNPEKAYGEFIRITEQFQRLSGEWEEFIIDFEIFSGGNHSDFRYQTESIMSQLEEFLAQGKGMALALLGRLAEAQKSFEHSKAILEKYPNPSYASLAEALGQLCLQQAKFDEAKQHFKSAYDSYIQFAVPEAWNEIVNPEDAVSSAFLSLEGAARILESIAQVALQRGNREAFLSLQLEAIEFAHTHELPRQTRKLLLNLYTWQLQWDVRGALADALKQKLIEIEKDPEDQEQVNFKIDKLFLEAENSILRGSKNQARKLLNEVRGILEKDQNLLDKRWKLHLAFSSYHEWQDEIETAIEHAEEALTIAKKINVPDLIQQAVETLVRLSNLDAANPEHQLRARQQLDEIIIKLRQIGGEEALAQSLMQRSLTYLLPAEQYEKALAELSEAKMYAKSRTLNQLIITAQAVAEKMSGKRAKALETLQEAIKLCQEQMLPKGEPSARSYRDLLHQTETLHEGAAILAAELGYNHEAFKWAEKGKTLLLQQQFAQSGNNLQDAWEFPQVSYDKELQQSLQEESAAVLFFCVGTGRTLALLLDPIETEPKSFFVDLKEKDLQETKLAKGLWPSSGAGESQFIQFLSYLSDKLLAPLAEVLEDIINRCDVLYIVPDSRLYLVPFSSLALNGKPLIEYDHCSLALIPSVSLWQKCRQRRLLDNERSCLVVGTGSANEFSFADQARAIMDGCNWKKTPDYLLDDEGRVTKERIWKAAKTRTVLHFSCHGMEEPMPLDTLSALHLILSDNEKWYAKDVFNHKNELSAELVFLNACMSGRFKLHEGLAIGGFWEAFLHAGATTIIGTLAEVHPEDAEQLARSFYQTWLKGNITKARALQIAQQELRRNKPNSFHWARYILIGDHR